MLVNQKVSCANIHTVATSVVLAPSSASADALWLARVGRAPPPPPRRSARHSPARRTHHQRPTAARRCWCPASGGIARWRTSTSNRPASEARSEKDGRRPNVTRLGAAPCQPVLGQLATCPGRPERARERHVRERTLHRQTRYLRVDLAEGAHGPATEAGRQQASDDSQVCSAWQPPAWRPGSLGATAIVSARSMRLPSPCR